MTFAQPPCCKRPQIANMDHVRGFEPDRVPMVSRCCLTCFAHWYGPADGEIRQYTRAEWDASIRESWERDAEECRQWCEANPDAKWSGPEPEYEPTDAEIDECRRSAIAELAADDNGPTVECPI